MLSSTLERGRGAECGVERNIVAPLAGGSGQDIPPTLALGARLAAPSAAVARQAIQRRIQAAR